MSRAQNTTTPDENGMYRVWCTPCDAEATFPSIVEAIAARKQHLCEGEVPSCSTGGSW